MVSPNSINILLILICLLLRFSIGHSLQASAKKSTVGTDVKLQAERVRSVKVDQMQQGVAAEVVEERTLRFGGGGGKMESSRRLSKAMRSQYWIDEASSTNSDKVHCIGTSDFNGGQGCVKRKFSKQTNRHSNSLGVNMSGFVSWNADYNVPRPHPPRNN